MKCDSWEPNKTLMQMFSLRASVGSFPPGSGRFLVYHTFLTVRPNPETEGGGHCDLLSKAGTSFLSSCNRSKLSVDFYRLDKRLVSS